MEQPPPRNGKVLPSLPPFQDFRVRGPYMNPNRGKPRRIVFLAGNGRKTSMSYARYLVCVREGRWLGREEQVDHIDNDRLNDSLDNLQILSPAANNAKGRPPRKMVELTCPSCGSSFSRERRQTHLVKGGNPTCCSRSCGRKRGGVAQRQSARFMSGRPVGSIPPAATSGAGNSAG